MRRVARTWRVPLATVAGAVVVMVGVAPVRSLGATCPGDCDESGDVTVDDVLTMVNVAAGNPTTTECAAGDSDESGTLTIDEILQAVNTSLNACAVVAKPTGSPSPTATPTQGRLGTQRFVMDPANSRFRAGLAAGPPPVVVAIGQFRGQTNGVVENAHIDFEAGQPDAQGIATLNITGASEYIFADAGAFAPLVLCLKPLVPVMSAGTVDCNGILDFSIVTSIDHKLGQVGVEGFTAAQCTAANGTIESPNQICAAGNVGAECAANADCDSISGAGDGACGLSDAICTAGKIGGACRNDAQCDSAPGELDGICGQPEPHPGVCNGPFEFGQGGQSNRPGEVTIAPVPQFGLKGLPVELTIESATPCGDEGPGLVQAFAMTTALSRTTVFHFNSEAVAFPFEQTGLNFDCRNWQNSPGKFVLSFAVLHQFSGGDVITGFEFGSAVPAPTASPTRTPTSRP